MGQTLDLRITEALATRCKPCRGFQGEMLEAASLAARDQRDLAFHRGKSIRLANDCGGYTIGEMGDLCRNDLGLDHIPSMTVGSTPADWCLPASKTETQPNHLPSVLTDTMDGLNQGFNTASSADSGWLRLAWFNLECFSSLPRWLNTESAWILVETQALSVPYDSARYGNLWRLPQKYQTDRVSRHSETA